MRALLPAIICLTSFLSLPALAQTAPATPDKLFVSAADLKAAVAKLKASRTDQPLVSAPQLSASPYRVGLEYRAGTAPASVHERDLEMMYVIEGTGAIVTGGKLVDEKRTNANNLTGSSIAGGNSQTVGAGDVLLIPEKIPHQVIPNPATPIVIVSVHVPRPVPAGWP